MAAEELHSRGNIYSFAGAFMIFHTLLWKLVAVRLKNPVVVFFSLPAKMFVSTGDVPEYQYIWNEQIQLWIGDEL